MSVKRNEVIGDWRKLRIERFRDFYHTLNTIQTKKSEMGVTCSTYGGEERRVQGLVWKSEFKRLLGKSRYV